ncbi:unnamed protein product [Musa acuminata subsp. malaccensis]|nr:unnamed protein product [Musa acuminata subsp. malaccensis]
MICHPDFYLCSHGTSRPAHYHALWDKNKVTADQLQTLTNNLCYMCWYLSNLWLHCSYARCAISIVPPAYYAYLAAFRAQFYMEPETSDSGSVAIKPLRALKDGVKRGMFSC